MELITMEVLKRRMRAALNDSDMDVRTMAEVAGISPATVRRYNDPSSPMSPKLLPVARVAQYYGQSLDALVFGEGTRKGQSETSAEFRAWTQRAEQNMTDEQKRIFMDYINMLLDFGIKA